MARIQILNKQEISIFEQIIILDRREQEYVFNLPIQIKNIAFSFRDTNSFIKFTLEIYLQVQKVKLNTNYKKVLTYDYNIKSSKIVELTKADIFQNEEIKEFITNIVTKIIIKVTEYQKNEEPYPLQLLLDLVSFKSKLNIQIEIGDEEINLNKISIKKLIIRENEFDIKFKNTTVTLTNINQIKSIQSYDTPPSEKEKDKQLREDIQKLKTILTEYPTEVSKPIAELIDGLSDAEEMFVF